MDKLTPESVAKHAEVWPCSDKAGLWRASYAGRNPWFALVRVSTAGALEYQAAWPSPTTWQRFGDDLDVFDWTPVCQDGSDMPDARAMERLQATLGERPDSLASGVHELISKFANQRLEARAQGRAEELAAIVAGLEHEIDARRRVGSHGVSMGTALSCLARLKAGEWSAKP